MGLSMLSRITDQEFPAFLMSAPFFTSTEEVNNAWMSSSERATEGGVRQPTSEG